MEVIISFNTGTQGIVQGCVHQNKPGDVIKTTGHSLFDNEKFWT